MPVRPSVCPIIAKFHYTDPTGPTRTLSETRTDPTEFLGDPGRKKVRAGPVGWGRAHVVEFSLNSSPSADCRRESRDEWKERKCADTTGTVLVPWANAKIQILQIKYTEAVLSNSTRKLLWFEISKMLVAV